MAGLASPSTDYVRGMIDWCKEHRGNMKNGLPNLPWDIINYHFYANDAGTDPSAKQTTGIAPELSKADSIAREFMEMSHIYAHDMPVWVTEAGYDLNPGSPQKALAIGSKNAEITQADWLLRTALLYAATGVQRLFFYQLHDDHAGSNARYATCGLVNKDNTSRPAANYLQQAGKLFDSYTYVETLSRQPLVEKYTQGDNVMYMLVAPDEHSKTYNYELHLDNGQEAVVYSLEPSSQNAQAAARKVSNGKLDLTVTETPTFVATGKQELTMHKTDR
jgi:endoglucanase